MSLHYSVRINDKILKTGCLYFCDVRKYVVTYVYHNNVCLKHVMDRVSDNDFSCSLPIASSVLVLSLFVTGASLFP